jgi:hypothetical protein
LSLKRRFGLKEHAFHFLDIISAGRETIEWLEKEKGKKDLW